MSRIKMKNGDGNEDNAAYLKIFFRNSDGASDACGGYCHYQNFIGGNEVRYLGAYEDECAQTGISSKLVGMILASISGSISGFLISGHIGLAICGLTSVVLGVCVGWMMRCVAGPT